VQRLAKIELDAGKNMMIKVTAKKPGTFEVGCHVAGHYEAGMKSAVTVK